MHPPAPNNPSPPPLLPPAAPVAVPLRFYPPPPPPPLHHGLLTVPPPPPVSPIQALRNILFILTDGQFEAEFALERQRRMARQFYYDNRAAAAQKKPLLPSLVINNNNVKKRPPPPPLPLWNKRPCTDNDTTTSNNSASNNTISTTTNNNNKNVNINIINKPIKKKQKKNVPYVKNAAAAAESADEDDDPSQDDESSLQGGEAGDEKKSKTWEEHYLDLIDFQKKHGHVKHKKLDEGYGALFHWLSHQKKQWKRMLQGQHCCIRHDHIQLLCDVGVGKSLKDGPIDFRREALDAVWQSLFQELVQFKKVHGHCEVSESKHKATHLKLALWCQQQRSNFQNRSLLPNEEPKRGRGGYMTDKQLQDLSKIGFRVSNVQLEFDDRLAQLQDYKQLFGHAWIPHAYTGFANLGNWAAKMRSFYNLHRLPADRIAKLNELGFEWSRGGRSVTAADAAPPTGNTATDTQG